MAKMTLREFLEDGQACPEEQKRVLRLGKTRVALSKALLGLTDRQIQRLGSCTIPNCECMVGMSAQQRFNMGLVTLFGWFYWVGGHSRLRLPKTERRRLSANYIDNPKWLKSHVRLVNGWLRPHVR